MKGARRLAAVGVLLAALETVPVTGAVTAEPAGAASAAGARALNWAEVHARGHWYGWGGVGPAVYDCSGTVYASVLHADGITLPRTTYGMTGSRYLYRIPLSDARRGDLLFYGPGHVEFATAWWHTSFGAQQAGTRVGWHKWSGWWAPTMAFRIR